MSQYDLDNASVALNDLLPRFRNISKFTVTQSDGKFTIYPEVSARIKDPVRRYGFQRDAITTLGDIADKLGKNAELHQGKDVLGDNLSLSFSSYVDLFQTLNVAEAQLKDPGARINPAQEALAKA